MRLMTTVTTLCAVMTEDASVLASLMIRVEIMLFAMSRTTSQCVGAQKVTLGTPKYSVTQVSTVISLVLDMLDTSLHLVSVEFYVNEKNPRSKKILSLLRFVVI